MIGIGEPDPTNLPSSPSIPMPLLQNRWHFIIDDSNIICEYIPKQAVRCSVDYINKTIDVEIEQDLNGYVNVELQALVGCTPLISIQAVDGYDEPRHLNQFQRCKMVKHGVKYDYTKSDVVIHHVQWLYDYPLFIGKKL